MAKRSKKAQAELDSAIDQLGGGAPPIPPPARPRARSRRAAKPRKAAKALSRKKKR